MWKSRILQSTIQMLIKLLYYDIIGIERLFHRVFALYFKYFVLRVFE